MRIWHEDLIPGLCRQHLLAVWREALGAYKIITENKQGYRNHPATQEFIHSPELLHKRLRVIRNEMIRRGYHPKELPELVTFGGDIREWENKEQQINKIKSKNCNCKV
jgi:uncharacterized protein (TIGR02328 family)